MYTLFLCRAHIRYNTALNTIMKFQLSILLALLSLFSCQNYFNSNSGQAYFAGEIINPNNDYVLLVSPDEKRDTLYLDQNNKFSIQIKNLTEGIYTFTHGGEYQIALIEPNDSIVLRLNTVDFDESLVFYGQGAKKNNFLVKIFLENEIEQQNFIKTSQLDPVAFERFNDSSRLKKLEGLKSFSGKKELTPLFQSIAEVSINYNAYANKEMYPFGYYGYNNLFKYKELPDSFYDYRKDIDYNIAHLRNHFVYNRFLYSHFNNLALDGYYNHAGATAGFDRHSVTYNVEKLRLIDSMIPNTDLKNTMMRNTSRDFISMCVKPEETDQLVSLYLKKSNNSEDKQHIQDLVTSINNLKSGNKVPNITIIDYQDNEHQLEEIIDAPTVIYFWSSNVKRHYKNSHYKIQELKTKFPNINFIAININDNDRKYWKETLDEFKFPTANEFRFKESNEGKKTFVINTVSKVILINKEKEIFKSTYNIFSANFEDALHALEGDIASK